MWHKIFADCAIFCVSRELIFAIRTDWYFLLGINFCDFQKVSSTQHDNILVFIEYVQQKYTFSNNEPAFRCFQMKETSCDWAARFRSTVFCVANLIIREYLLWSKFLREKYLRELIFADRWKKPQKLEPAKVSCHTVDRPTRFEILDSFIFIHNCIRSVKGFEGILRLFRMSVTFNQICIHSMIDDLNFKATTTTTTKTSITTGFMSKTTALHTHRV